MREIVKDTADSGILNIELISEQGMLGKSKYSAVNGSDIGNDCYEYGVLSKLYMEFNSLTRTMHHYRT